MELARAFTKRNRHPEMNLLSPTRATSVRKHDGSANHSMISAPLELLSTTNVLAYNAPDLFSTPSSATSTADDSDSSAGFMDSSRGTTPETSSIESTSPCEPEENHLTNYFRSSNRTTTSSQQSTDTLDSDAPAVPARARSHTKRSHQAVARARSMTRNTPPPVSIHSNPHSVRNSIDIFSDKPDAGHPFGAELEQVNELAEEMGARNVLILDDDEQYLMSHGLQRYGVQDYMDEIQGLFGSAFGNPFKPFNAMWI